MTDEEKIAEIIEYAKADPDCYDDLIRYLGDVMRRRPVIIQPVYDFIKKNPGLGSNHVLWQVGIYDPEDITTEDDYIEWLKRSKNSEDSIDVKQ